MVGGTWGRVAVAVVGISVVGQGIAPVEVAVKSGAAAESRAQPPGDCCGGPSSWTSGDKSALGTAAGTASPLWFTVAGGGTCFIRVRTWPTCKVCNTWVTDGKSFVDLDRDATEHVVSTSDEYTVANTAKNGRYRLTATYVTDAGRPTLLSRTRFR
ncbi:Glucoamylase precursor [Amycolatopsis sp. M39]|nr:Glucoamylase precursor [Amycolatopsis sp. M39]